MSHPSTALALLLALPLAACANGAGAATAGGQPNHADLPACDPDDGGLELPAGFCALVVVEDVAPGAPRARHLAVAPNGDLYVAVQGRRNVETPSERGAVVGLRDTDGDGRMDERVTFGPEGGTGLEIRDGYLYFATNTAVLRYRLGGRGLEPAAGPDTLVYDLPAEQGHTAKSLAFGPGDRMWVNVGSYTNACQPLDKDRQAGVMGVDPCTQLETTAGVWLFEADRLRQRQDDGMRWATGIRNAVALAYHPTAEALYAVQHGRDQLNLWPGFTVEQNALRVAEELQLLTEGADFGWPYCYFDTDLQRRVLAPEYGGDGREVGRCADKDDPLLALPAHWAPNDLLFYTGDQFPEEYRGGAFIAFHGSWNRAPLEQAGYNVSFVPFSGGRPSGPHRVFADGFTGPDPQPRTAEHRPMGLALAPDGSLLISDSSGGRIWRVLHTGR